MKKTFILIFSCIAILGCKKNPFEYRTKFLGNYNFIIHSSFYAGTPTNHYTRDTTYSVDGKIWYGSDKNTISITFSGSWSSEFTIYEDGTIEGGGCRGEFESTNKIKYSCYWASPASHTNQDITGIKK